MMQQLLTLFYRLPLAFIAQSFAVGALGALLLLRRFRQDRRLRRGLWVLWCLSVLVILAATLLHRQYGTPMEPKLTPLHSVLEYWRIGEPEILRTSFMNVVLFFPAGFLQGELLHRSWSGRKKLAAVLLAFCALSVGIELAQHHYALGEPDVDDVLFNTLGAALGAGPILLEKRLLGAHDG